MSNLREKDYEKFKGFGVPPEMVDAEGIHRVDREEAELELGFEIKEGPATGISFPTFPPAPLHHLFVDPTKPVGYRIRRDDMEGADKYLASIGKSRLYPPKSIPREWFEDPTTPVRFFESEKSALAMVQWCLKSGYRSISVATGGCWGHRAKIGKAPDENGDRVDVKGLLPWIKDIAAGHPCIIHPDANEFKPMVHAGYLDFARMLRAEVSRDVSFCRLPPNEPGKKQWNGFDDFVALRGPQAVFALIGTAQPFAEGETSTEESLICVPFTEIVSKPVKWLWPQRLVSGYINVLSGNPDEGKSCVAIDLIARYTTGRDWPDGEKNIHEPGSVLVLLAEDGAEDAYKPRMAATGVDMSKVTLLKGIAGNKKLDRQFALDQDLGTLKKHLQLHPEIKLVVVDPASSYVRNHNMDKEQEARRVLGPIGELCQELDITVLFIGHFNKRSDVSALQRVSGAVANTGYPRSVWMYMSAPDEPGVKLMLLGKGNYAKKRTGMRYRCVSAIVVCDNGETADVPVVEWLGEETEANAQSITDAQRNPAPKVVDQAEKFLRQYLANDEQPSEELIEAAKKKGIGRSNLFGAKKKLGFRAVKRGGAWFWPAVDDWGKADRVEAA